MMVSVRVSRKGQITIPKSLRTRLGIKEGGEVDLIEDNGSLFIVPVPDDVIHTSYGMFRGGPSLTEPLLESRREDNEREEREIAWWAERAARRRNEDQS